MTLGNAQEGGLVGGDVTFGNAQGCGLVRDAGGDKIVGNAQGGDAGGDATVGNAQGGGLVGDTGDMHVNENDCDPALGVDNDQETEVSGSGPVKMDITPENS